MANDDPKLLYYDADGKRVPEGDPRSVRQFLSDDPARPDATNRRTSNVVESRTTQAEPVTVVPEAEEDEVIEATKTPATEEKAQARPAANKARTSSANK